MNSVSTPGNAVCANPSVTPLAGGGFLLAAWSQRSARPDSWDVYARSFDANRAPVTVPFRLNTYTYGDQFGPRWLRWVTCNSRWTSWAIVMVATRRLWPVSLRWCSPGRGFDDHHDDRERPDAPGRGQRFSRPDIVGLDVLPGTCGQRIQFVWPALRSHGADSTAGSPFVAALSSSRPSLTWTPLSGFPIAAYEIYMDGVQPPDPPTAVVTANVWTQTGLVAAHHTFRLAYLMEGGARLSYRKPPRARPGAKMKTSMVCRMIGKACIGPAGLSSAQRRQRW